MNELNVAMIIAFLCGILLGLFFFGGLWWTIRNFLCSPRVAPWMLLSSLVRLCVLLAGLYVVSAGGWMHIICCLCGIVLGRQIVVRLTSLQKVGHAHQS